MCYNNFCQQDKGWQKNIGRCGETGRRTGLKILRDQSSHAGSIPAICTMRVRKDKVSYSYFLRF